MHLLKYVCQIYRKYKEGFDEFRDSIKHEDSPNAQALKIEYSILEDEKIPEEVKEYIYWGFVANYVIETLDPRAIPVEVPTNIIEFDGTSLVIYYNKLTDYIIEQFNTTGKNK